MTAKTVSPGERRGSLSRLAGWVGPWETALLGLVVVVLIFGSVTSPFFFTGANFSNTSAGAVGVSLMVVGQTWLMVSGEIDLSVASVFGISGVVFGLSIESRAPLPVAIAIALLVGAVAGLINGLLSVDLGLPSLIVTVGSLALFRGASYILLGSRAISALPIAFTGFAQGDVGTSVLPNVLVVFLVIAVLAGTFLQWGSVGRKTYAAGSSLEVSRFSGHRVKRLKRGLFVLSGALSALAGVLYTGYVSTARADNGTGQELTVIAIVLIGGVSMFGGKGSFIGVMLSLVLVTSLTSLMTLNYTNSDVQSMVIGLLMVGAVVVPRVIRGVRVMLPGRRGPRAKGGRI